MKRIYILLLLSFTTLTSCGQESYLFKSKINPEKIYHSTMSIQSENQTEYNGIVNGQENKTMNSKSSTKMTRIITTQKANENEKIPATLEYGKIISIANGTQTESPLSGTMVTGIYLKNKFSVQEVISDKLDEKTKETIKYALENVKADIEFPEKPLKIGDSFEHKMPMTIPVDGANPVKIDIIKNFTLKSVENGIAIFDLKEKIMVNTEVEQGNVSATGDGKGKVEYDIIENQIIVNNSTFSINMNVKIGKELSVNSIIKSISNIKTSIE